MGDLTLLRFIPFIPLAAAALNIFFGERWGRSRAGLLACAAVALSFVLSLWLFAALPAGGSFKDTVFTWIDSEPFRADVSFRADALTAGMLLVVTGVGLLIHIYSLGYMGHDPGMVRYFAYLNLFVFFMLLLVMADNLLFLFVGWEGVGLCSYLLIGFWCDDHTNAVAGNKAFVVNRIGDFGFLIGMLLLFWEMGRAGVWTLDLWELKANSHLLSPEAALIITLLLFFGATGKSAQIPLYVWLPDAMQGPTPVSALIHAATMVTAGVYMIARLHFLYALAPATLALIAAVGALTALFAATIAIAQNDIKRVLAYSTVSQLGYMFLAVGVGAYSAAIFHLFTHAFFKACLFLGAGSVIHGLEGEQDMRRMGGLKAYLPTTYWTYLIAALAISGMPLTAGFFSKDQILWHAFASASGSIWLWLSAWLTAGLTAFYMFRQFFMVFHGDCRVSETARSRIHESPRVMTVPLVLLALGSVIAGWVGAPEFLWGSPWDHYLEPVFAGAPKPPHGGVGKELVLMGFTLAIAAGGFALAYVAYGPAAKGADRIAAMPGAELLRNKYYVDEIYELFFVRPFARAADYLAGRFDPGFIDGIVNGAAEQVRGSSQFWRRAQSGNIQHYLLGFLAGAVLVLAYYLSQ